MNPDPAQSRELLQVSATNVYRAHVRRVLGTSIPEVAEGGALRAVARTLANVGELEAAEGLRTDPPFPGAAEQPEKMGEHWRMITATRVFLEARPLGTIFTTFVSGRGPVLFMSPPEAEIPASWTPIVEPPPRR